MLQLLEVKQTQLLFEFFHGHGQSVSPESCNESRENSQQDGVFLLPTLSFSGGDQLFTCETKARAVLVDLGGLVPTGDTYTAADGTVLHFVKNDLQQICDDVVRSFTDPLPATVDRRPLRGVAVSTRAFPVKINSDANDPFPFFDDALQLHGRGTLYTCYTGRKALVPLSRGKHVITVDLTSLFGPTGPPTHLTYIINVTRS